MFAHDAAQMYTSLGHVCKHESALRYAIGDRQFFNRLRERGTDKNIATHKIVNQKTHM